jgi:putative ABC transport system permease protein
MTGLRIFFHRLLGLFLRRKLERELDEEIRSHFEMQIEDNLRQGMSPEDARRAARLRFGGMEQVKEAYRDKSRLGWMENLWQDLRYGVRMLMKRPSFTLIVALTLGLGIGANTAVFSVIDAVLLKPLPYVDPERLVVIYGGFLASGDLKMVASAPEFYDYREQTQSFDSLGAYQPFGANLALDGAGEPERVEGGLVTPEMFSVLRASPFSGRVFLPEEAQDGRDGVVVLGYGLWRRRFAGDEGVIGRRILINGRSVTVVGVMRPGFAFPQQAEVWLPLWFRPEQRDQRTRGARSLLVVARLKPGVSQAQAQEAVDQLSIRQTEQYPRNYRERRWKISLAPLADEVVGDMRQLLVVLLGAVAFVLLIACANVANLLLARSAARSQEMAIRAALGAGRGRIVRQLLTENVALALVGGVVGLVFAWWSVRALLRFVPDNQPRIAEAGIDGRVLVFTCVVSLVTGLVFGLAPALFASRPDTNETLKESGRSGLTGKNRQRMRSSLIVTEIALALALAIGAGLTLKSFWRLQEVNPGFNPDGVLTMRLLLPAVIYSQPAQRIAFYQQVLEKIKALPDVESVSAASAIPMTADGVSGTVSGENSSVGPNDLPVETEMRWVTPEYFRALGIEMLRGRAFTEADAVGTERVAIVDESFVRRFYPNEDPLGKRIKRGRLDSANPWVTVVGVVRQVRDRRLDTASRVQAYFPYYQESFGIAMSLAVRTKAADPLSLAGVIRGTIKQVDRNQPVYSVKTLRQLTDESVAPRRLTMLLVGVFAAVALVLAAVGIYGVMSYIVLQRRREWGIRLALGAQGADVLKLVIKQVMAQAMSGILIGLAGAWALTRLMTSVLYGVNATDAGTFLVISVLVSLVALLAVWVPARRAMKVDPLITLKYE